MDKSLYELEVVDRQSFIKFLSLLHNSYQLNKVDWENVDLDSFLEAMIRYSEDVSVPKSQTVLKLAKNINVRKISQFPTFLSRR